MGKVGHSTGLDTYEPNLSEIDSFSPNELFRLKTDIEIRLAQNIHLLTAVHQTDMETPLVTEDGFPKGDIDILQVILIRKNINMLRNDLVKVLDRCKFVLENPVLDRLSEKITNEINESKYVIPFAIVNHIVEKSPSSQSGLQIGDKIVKFGSIHAGNHRKLKAVQTYVLKNKYTPVSVKILRNGELLSQELTPTNHWEGTGLLGCKLLEI